MKTQILLKSRLFRRAITLLVIDGLFFGLTNPNKINSIFLIVGFILLGLSLYVLIQIIISMLQKSGFKISNRHKIGGFIVGLVILVLALQSIGQLTATDILIIVPLTILLYVYTAYVRPKSLN